MLQVARANQRYLYQRLVTSNDLIGRSLRTPRISLKKFGTGQRLAEKLERDPQSDWLT